MKVTKYFEGKTETSYDEVSVDPEVMERFRGYQARGKDIFVIESPRKPNPRALYEHYRCDHHFRALNRWLRQQGITSNKPVHTLRKEFGSQLTAKYGIHAASVALRHADISITNAFYSDTKARVRVGLGQHLNAPDNKIIDISSER